MSCLPALASSGGNCVAYARDVTGVQIDGNAALWWPHAEGRYDRGHTPSFGAILVFKPYAGMRVGHVAVVSRVVSAREVLVDQANWVRGRVTKAMSVVDASPFNDWTSVKVIEPHSGKHGRENPTYGFIYPRVLPANFGEAVAETPTDRHTRHTGPVARTKPQKDHTEIAMAEPEAKAVHAKPKDGAPAAVEPAKTKAAHAKHHKDATEVVAAEPTEAKAAPAPDGKDVRELAATTPPAGKALHAKHHKDGTEVAAAGPPEGKVAAKRHKDGREIAAADHTESTPAPAKHRKGSSEIAADAFPDRKHKAQNLQLADVY
jgi:surface antigen